MRTPVLLTLALGAVLACGAPPVSLACRPVSTADDVAARASTYDSLLFTVGGHHAQICYSRPAANGRVIFGGLVPFDSLWRTGANEPTILHLPFAAEIAGLAVPAGHYSLYTVPGATRWQLVVNRSTGQWGITRDEARPDGGVNRSAYTAEVAAQELGRAPLSADSIDFVERFTIRADSVSGDASTLLLEWERTRVRIPIRLSAPAP